MTIFVLPFEKMHGLGNDFILVEKRHLPKDLNYPVLAKHLCKRNFAIGADGLIVVDLASKKDTEFEWHYYNSDGSEAEMCGNGMRCFAKYVFERGFIDELSFSVLTKAGVIKPQIETNGSVTINMGIPKLAEQITEKLDFNSGTIAFTYVEIGNPHCVILRDTVINDTEFFHLGPGIEKHKRFPNGINVEFVNVVNSKEIICRVWERGCGATLACGTGACAAVIATNLNKLCGEEVKVSLPGGDLFVRWDKSTNNIYLNGPATFVYCGQFNLDLDERSLRK